jgi:hypothetical protein
VAIETHRYRDRIGPQPPLQLEVAVMHPATAGDSRPQNDREPAESRITKPIPTVRPGHLKEGRTASVPDLGTGAVLSEAGRDRVQRPIAR